MRTENSSIRALVFAALVGVGCSQGSIGDLPPSPASDFQPAADPQPSAPATNEAGVDPNAVPTGVDLGGDAGTAAEAASATDAAPASDAAPATDTAPPAPTAPTGKLVAYYANWTRSTMPPSTIPWSQLTHVAHAFILPTSTGNLSSMTSYVDAELISTAHAHGVKVVASVGGWGADFSAMTDPAKRALAVADMTTLCRTYGYDGIDIDWEFPTAANVASWSALMSELRASLDKVKPGLSISAAVGSGPSLDLAVLPSATLLALDWIGVMTYDYAGSWSTSSGHNSPIHATKGGDGGSVDASIQYLVATRALDRSKVFVGLPFYGYSFGGNDLATTPVAPSTEYSYADVVAAMATGGWTKKYDSAASVPYLTRAASPGFLTYDDATSIGAKCAYAKANALGGAIIWHLAGDRLPDGSNPLLAAAQGCR